MVQVSVVIPTYNRAGALKRAIQSVLAQTFQDLEIIVVDDCSKDDIESVVKQIGDDRVRFFRHETNKGGSAARNTGIAHAQGDFIAFLDSDDKWLQTKLEKQLKVFDRSSDRLGVVYTGLSYYDEDGGFLYSVHARKRGRVLDNILVSNFVGSFSSVMARSDLVQEVDGLDSSFKSCQDWEFYIRLSKICEFDFVDEDLVEYFVAKADPTRISNSNRSIVSGHNAIREKFSRDYVELADEKKAEFFLNMVGVYASVGDFRTVVGLSYKAHKCSNKIGPLLALPRRLARCFKMVLFRRSGY